MAISFDDVTSLVAAGGLAAIWRMISGHKKEVAAKIDKMESGIEKSESVFLEEKKHELLCENNTLKIEAHITQEISELKNAIFPELRMIKTILEEKKK